MAGNACTSTLSTVPEADRRSCRRRAAMPGRTSWATPSTTTISTTPASTARRRIYGYLTARGARRRLSDRDSVSQGLGGAHRRGRARRRRAGTGGRRVLELLLRAEQRVEHLGAKLLVGRDGDAAADSEQQQQPAEAEPPLALLGRVLDRFGRLARGLIGVAQVALQLLVLEQG